MIVVVMGVCGCGKSTVGGLLAERLDARFEEGDKYHPATNIEKMSGGEPLEDADRWPWLRRIAERIDAWLGADERTVVTCSALKEAYRRILIGSRADVHLVYLRGSRELIARRLAERRGHFMPPDLLPSQFAALEEPRPADNVITVDIDATPEAIVSEILTRLEPQASALSRL